MKYEKIKRHMTSRGRANVVECPAYGISIRYFPVGMIVQRTIPRIGAFRLSNPVRK